MKKITIRLVGFLLFAGSVFYVQAAEPVQERWINATYVKDGVIDTGSASVKLAVRSGPGLKFSQIDALSSGQKVETFETKTGWIRIGSASAAPVAVAKPVSATAPATAPAGRWINSAYLKSGVIDKHGVVDTGSSSAKLAVRSGPGLGFSQVDALSTGQKVEIFETQNGWSRIAVSGAASVPVPATVPVPIAKPALAKSVKTAPVSAPVPAPVAKPRPVPQPVTASAVSAAPPRTVSVPVRPPVSNLILNGDFSATALALPTATGDTTAELSGRWLRSVVSAWEISPSGGNLGSYARAAASREAGRLLYVANDAKRSTGSYLLRFDYILTDPSDALGVKVFVSDRDITIGTDGGDFRMNNSQRPSDAVMLPAGASWVTYDLPVELGSGYNYVYVLFTGSGAGNTGIDNISLSPKRR